MKKFPEYSGFMAETVDSKSDSIQTSTVRDHFSLINLLKSSHGIPWKTVYVFPSYLWQLKRGSVGASSLQAFPVEWVIIFSDFRKRKSSVILIWNRFSWQKFIEGNWMVGILNHRLVSRERLNLSWIAKLFPQPRSWIWRHVLRDPLGRRKHENKFRYWPNYEWSDIFSPIQSDAWYLIHNSLGATESKRVISSRLLTRRGGNGKLAIAVECHWVRKRAVTHGVENNSWIHSGKVSPRCWLP